GTGQIIIQHPHLVPFVLLDGNGHTQMDDGFPQDRGKPLELFIGTDPDSIDHSHSIESCGHGLRYQYPYVRILVPHIGLELFYPTWLKVLGPLTFVIDPATILSGPGIDDLDAVPSPGPFFYLFDTVQGKLG